MNTLCLLAAEEQTSSQLAEALYTTWNQLKGLRQHQKFISTPAKLVAINVHTRQSNVTTNMIPSTKQLLDYFEAGINWIASHASTKVAIDHSSVLKRYRRLLISTSDFVLKLYTTI